MRPEPGDLHIGDRRVGPGESCYIIAEAGVNHNGDLSIAKKLVDEAKNAGADAVKFQKRKLDEVYQNAILNQPRKGEQGLQYLIPLLVEFELSDDDFRELRDYCKQQEVMFLCTPWDRVSVDFLEELNVAAYKIGSPDMTNFPLIEYVAQTNKPMFVSTGMSTEDEIRRTLHFLGEHRANYGLFHCVSTYPVAADEINLRFMQKLAEWSGRPVGYSGHDTGITVALAAVAMGASMLEKHITLDRSMRGPDHSASLEPDTFASMVKAVREAESAFGIQHRWITQGEMLNRRALGKSLVATADLPAGTIIERHMIGSKSPGLGLSPQLIDQLVGHELKRDVRSDEMFVQTDLQQETQSPELETVDVGRPWGVVARFTDVDNIVSRFASKGMSLIEFHVSDRDLDIGVEGFRSQEYPFGLVVHAPEYFHDYLIDLCANDPERRQISVSRIQRAIDLARGLAPWFPGVSKGGPKVVIHVGGMSPEPEKYDVARASENLLDSIRRLDRTDVDLLLENLPPYPWYFGGRWFGHVLVDPEHTRDLCVASGLGLCFDTSHGALECHRTGYDIVDFARLVSPYTRHLHISDAAGVSGEGLQIGEGQVDFAELMPVLARMNATCVPEIWMGHHRNGDGFSTALERLTETVWATKSLAHARTRAIASELRPLVVRSSASVATVLRIIDENALGIAFVLGDEGTMQGIITDGDIRRSLLSGKTLDTSVAEVMNRDFVFAEHDMDGMDVRARLSKRVRVLPVLDRERRVVSYSAI